MSKQIYILKNLSNWLKAKGMDPNLHQEPMGALRPDLVATNDNKFIVIEIKLSDAYRSKVFPALIGDMILRSQSLGSDQEFMAALLIKKINIKAINDLRQYTRKYMPKLNWFLLDENGNGMASLWGKESELSFPPLSLKQNVANSPSIRGGLFSSSARKMLKHLLLPGIDPRYWGGSQKRPSGIVELAHLSGVSQPSVSSLVKRFEAAGYIKRKNGIPLIIRHEELLDDWFHAVKHDNKSEHPVRSLYGDPVETTIDKIRTIQAENKNPSMIIGHHMACHLHGIGRSSLKSANIYIKQPNIKIMDKLELVADDSPSPSLWLMQRDIESVFQGSVIINDLSVCDILQCYLDVRSSRARGQEQADYILENILTPHFRSR